MRTHQHGRELLQARPARESAEEAGGYVYTAVFGRGLVEEEKGLESGGREGVWWW